MTPQTAAQTHPLAPVPYRITRVQTELPDVFTWTLDCKERPFAFQPGQFNMLYAFGHGEVPISISGDPANPHTLIHTIRNVGPVTAAMQAIKAGEMIGVRGPFGTAWPVADGVGKDVVIMAGGLGLAPLRPALYHLLTHRADYGKVTLLYGTRTPDSVLYPDELLAWADPMEAAMDVAITVDGAGPDWHGHVGVVTELLRGRDVDPANTLALLCGPEIMMRFCAHALLDLGLPGEAIQVSMERNMKCAIGLCGRCQYGPYFICRDGAVFPFDRVEHLFGIREL